jgi:transposase
MRKDIIAMSQKERQRYHLLKMVIDGKSALKEASRLMGVSYRLAKRLKKKLISEGAKVLIHGNRGRPSPKALSHELVGNIFELSLSKYTNFNDTHFTEKLKEEEGITVGRDTVRRLRTANGIKPKRRRRAKRYHKRRPRKPQEGMMVLWDGGPHRWFGKEREPCCLMAETMLQESSVRPSLSPMSVLLAT